MNDKEEEKSIC